MEPIGDLANATQQADAIFERLGEAITGVVTEKGASEINVLEVAQSAGLEIDAATLERLQIPELVPVIRFMPWHCWWPWRPLWCWWWRRHYPHYHCCHYWWCGSCYFGGHLHA